MKPEKILNVFGGRRVTFQQLSHTLLIVFCTGQGETLFDVNNPVKVLPFHLSCCPANEILSAPDNLFPSKTCLCCVT